MKLTIISSITENERDTNSFLKDLTEQDTQDFEVILCLNKSSSSKKIFSLISEYGKFFGSRLKVVWNYKNQSVNYNIASAFRIAKGNYVTIINSDTSLRKYYLLKMIEQATKYDVDVLEFKPRLIGSTRWKPKARIITQEPVKIANRPDVFAYTFPFILNKIFKRTVVQKYEKNWPKQSADDKLAVSLNYQLMLLSKTYMYVDSRIKRDYFDLETWINPKTYINNFKDIEKMFMNYESKIMHEYEYAKNYFFKVFLPGLITDVSFISVRNLIHYKELNEKRSKKFVDELKVYIDKLQKSPEFKMFMDTNNYMLLKNNETDLIKNNIPISKWRNILNELEE